MEGKPVVLLGITGSIAAYKACELVRRLKDLGADVHCIMTKSATQFVTPLTLQTLSRNPVHSDHFAAIESWDAEHIALADAATVVIICPATANVLGKVASGIADDLLSSVVMASATRAKVVFCPAMNPHMYGNPIVQANVRKLEEYGYLFVEPEEGLMACGAHGKGRLASLETILDKVKPLLA